MTSTINEFIRFLSSPEENEFQGESANGMHASAYSKILIKKRFA